MKSLLKSLIISLSFLMTNSVIAEEAKSVQWLFVHTAETAEMTSETTLSMPVTKEIFAFSDRPNRLHHYLDAHGFAMLWFQGGENAFRVDPPNAVLTWTADGVVKESEIILRFANALDDGKIMEYTVQFEQEPLLTNEILSNVSLFIDSYGGGMRVLMPCAKGCYRKWCGGEPPTDACSWTGSPSNLNNAAACKKWKNLSCNTLTGQMQSGPNGGKNVPKGCTPKPNSGVKLGPMGCMGI